MANNLLQQSLFQLFKDVYASKIEKDSAKSKSYWNHHHMQLTRNLRLNL